MREGLKSNSWHAKIEMRPKNLLKNKKLKGIRDTQKKPINPKLNPDSSNNKSCKTTESSISQ